MPKNDIEIVVSAVGILWCVAVVAVLLGVPGLMLYAYLTA